jgi:hypothetical protein
MDISIVFLLGLLLFTIYLHLRYNLETFQTTNNTNKEYKPNIINVDYHDSAKKIEKDFGYGINLKSYTFIDPKRQKKITTKIPEFLQLPTYNKPGHYKYGYETYVPTYKDQILLTSN